MKYRIMLLSLAIVAIFTTQCKKGKPVTCTQKIGAVGLKLGDTLKITCPANCGGSVWGVKSYTSDSAICAAAIHSGKISKSGGSATLEVVSGQDKYEGSEKNGIKSRSWGKWKSGFIFK
ncbi:MAG: LCCL domain-containing protein [Spirochaetota bacterium]